MSAKLAIVSPCSSCKNQRSALSDDGRPACPRRAWQVARQRAADQGLDTTRFDHLVQPGDAGTGADGSLSNPVYWDEGNTIMVWVATVQDNCGTFDQSGALLSPPINDPGFDTDTIQCRQSPAIPLDAEAQYFQKGAFNEGDQLLLIETPSQQPFLSTGNYERVPFAGVVTKLNLLFNVPRQPVSKDLSPKGF